MNHLLSLLLGLLSWGLGIAAICRGCGLLTPASLMCCAASLLPQLFQVRQLVRIGDWTALMDTTDAVVLAAAVLLTVTAALNLAALLRRKY